jgi:chromosome segregation protein
MYFKQIEMTGFKSFAERTLVNLEQGMTSVVGPNGCGKSNILDAMKWALGEQRAKELRGAHMQDVIFNGSEDRPPMSMAEVTLTFDNSDGRLPLDFSEIQVTRRVYRSGESEYLINKSNCRLRDVQELFMDTGIGTNAYSMIGQGKISMVLSSKPEDRRYLFEEAAGIIKYKSRKRVALRKLDQAEQNQLRLGDVINELERQMRSLKRQVNAAIRHKDLTGQLKEFEIRASFLKQQSLLDAVTGLQERYDNAKSSFDLDNEELTRLETRHEELNTQKLESDRELHARRESVHDIDLEMEKLEGQISTIRQQIQFLLDQQENAESERVNLLGKSEDGTSTLEMARKQSGDLRLHHDEIKARFESNEEKQQSIAENANTADTILESTRTKSVESMGARAQTQTTIETLSVNIGNIEEQLHSLYERQEALNRRNEELVADLESKQRSETEVKSELTTAEDVLEKAQTNQSEITQAITDLNAQWQELRESKSSSDARLKSLSELRDSYEGFAHGVRSIMQAQQQSHPSTAGIRGPVGDLITTPKEFEKAVEAALAGSINHIVVNEADQAKQAIRFLKDRKSGRVTFLPLDTIRAGRQDFSERVRGEIGVVGPVLDHVQYDPEIKAVMEYLFSNTVLVDTIDDAILLARTDGPIPRLVTREGEVVSGSGAVTGGQTKHDTGGLLGRSAEIEELEKTVAALELDIQKLAEKGSTKAEDLETAKVHTSAIAEEVEGRRRALSALEVEINQAGLELSRIIESLQTFEQERDTLYARRDELEVQRQRNQDKATTMESEDETLQREIADAQDAASRARQEQSEMASTLSDLRVQMANVTKSLEENEREIQRIERETEQAREDATKRQHAIDEFNQNRINLENEIQLEAERSKALMESKEEARSKVSDGEEQRQKLLDESDLIEKTLRDLRDKVGESQSVMHHSEMELQHDQDQLAFFRERIQTEYQIDLGSLTTEDIGNDEMADEERDQLVQEIRDKLDRMGSVNLMAIEEYEALTERYEFLEKQQSDLQQARETLMGVVARIDETIKVMFLETFYAVSENFKINFRRLFNGGQARIYLADEENPLDCGIEIEARPPGKKPQTIALLSGGEQAMTAIALLFSIFKAKPSPFCVLDEVDAPLDDANIGRFIEMVEEFTQDTQFVVITHNKQTMAKAGALYGVTQQERGVSQIVSVKLRDVKTEDAA